MTLSKSSSDPISKVLIKKYCALLMSLFIKIHKKKSTTSCKEKILLLDLYSTSLNDASYYRFGRKWPATFVLNNMFDYHF